MEAFLAAKMIGDRPDICPGVCGDIARRCPVIAKAAKSRQSRLDQGQTGALAGRTTRIGTVWLTTGRFEIAMPKFNHSID
jgi:hypothetical protein